MGHRVGDCRRRRDIGLHHRDLIGVGGRGAVVVGRGEDHHVDTRCRVGVGRGQPRPRDAVAEVPGIRHDRAIAVRRGRGIERHRQPVHRRTEVRSRRHIVIDVGGIEVLVDRHRQRQAGHRSAVVGRDPHRTRGLQAGRRIGGADVRRTGFARARRPHLSLERRRRGAVDVEPQVQPLPRRVPETRVRVGLQGRLRTGDELREVEPDATSGLEPEDQLVGRRPAHPGEQLVQVHPTRRHLVEGDVGRDGLIRGADRAQLRGRARACLREGDHAH